VERVGAIEQERLQGIGLAGQDGLRQTIGRRTGYQILVRPVEAGLGWTVKEKPIDHIGKGVLLRQKRSEGVSKRLVGFRMCEPGVPRQGYALYREGQEAGIVTSGMKSPTLGGFWGMGYLWASEVVPVGQEIEVEIREGRKRAEVVRLPFYRGSVRRPSPSNGDI
jgi:aminomethyltransferase